MEPHICVSLLIVAYNAEVYLDGCLKAATSQRFDGFEVVVADDGSTDQTASIATRWAAKDKRVRVLTLPHRGVASTRQAALDAARGDYFIFVDADDQVAPTMLQELYDKAMAEQADLVIADYEELRNEGTLYRKQEPTALKGMAILEDILDGRLYGALWNKLLRTDMVRACGARFPDGLSMREDLVFLSQVLPHISRVAYLPKALYGYERRNVSSLTNNYLNESADYYRQEVLWNTLLLDNAALPDRHRQQKLTYLARLAYITLNLFDRTEWQQAFSKHALPLNGYRGRLVRLALHGHFGFARIIRTLIAKVK